MQENIASKQSNIKIIQIQSQFIFFLFYYLNKNNSSIIVLSMFGNPINLTKLKQMIKDGIASIPKDPNADQAIIVIGDTGVGKSTLLAFLSGYDLTVRYDGLKPILDCPYQGEAIKIGHNKYSQTSIPRKVLIENFAFYDCPGFKDNKGEQYEISNSFFIQRLLDIYPKVKIVLMVDETHISEARADKLPKLTKNLLKSFETFEDIKEGVVMIINRAQRDHTPQDYHKEIRKMCQLRTQRGPLFEIQQQNFLNYLIRNNRIVLFKQPRKEDKNQKYIPTEAQRDILKTIKYSSFVKSKHILNILSESAKLAIRDFIDEVTSRSNLKIQAICAQIISNYSKRLNQAGKDLGSLISMKQQVIKLAEQIRSAAKQDIVKILQRQLPESKMQDFTQDFAAVMFFKNIYDKTSTYFSNLVNKIYSQLSHLLVKMDNKIIKIQKEEQQDMEKKRQLQKRKELQEQKQKQRNQMQEELRRTQNLKIDVGQMARMSENNYMSICNALDLMKSLDQQVGRLKQDCSKFQQSNHEIVGALNKLDNNYMRRSAY